MGKTRQFFVALRRLESWFERNQRILPWRDRPTLYRVWVSEVMLQQTQVVTVIPYFERFLAAFPNVEALAAAPEAEVLRLWAGLGYYRRARNLKAAAQMIVKTGFPQTREGWLELPGVGEYTAGAILSIALDQPEAILDANVERVLSRVRKLTDKARIWRISRAFVETGVSKGIRPSVLNQGLMELGATICTPKAPRCSICPLFDICYACASGVEENFPVKKKSKEWLRVDEELHCVVDAQGRVLMREREAGEWRAGLWDLVEKPKGSVIAIGMVETRHTVTRHKIFRKTHVWKSCGRAFKKAMKTGQWVTVKAPEVALGSAARKSLQAVSERFPEVFRTESGSV